MFPIRFASDMSDLSEISDPDMGLAGFQDHPWDDTGASSSYAQPQRAQQGFRAVVNSAFVASDEDVRHSDQQSGTGERPHLDNKHISV